MTFEDARYAISFAPRKWSALWRFGRAWLGRDAATGEAVARLALADFSQAELAALTAEPARHAWRAALTAPFCLKAGTTPGELVAHTMSFAAARLPFEIPALALASIDGALALVPRAAPALLAGLGVDCVRAFAPFREWPDENGCSSRAGRGRARASENTSFRLPLTGPLAAAERARVEAALGPRLHHLLARPVAVDAVSVFVALGPRQPFRELRRCAFAGAG